MRLSPRLGLFVKSFDVVLELLAVDSPHASSTDLDRGEFSRTNQRVDLRNAHAQVGRNVLEREEARLDLRPRRLRGSGGHALTITRHDDGYVALNAFAAV